MITAQADTAEVMRLLKAQTIGMGARLTLAAGRELGPAWADTITSKAAAHPRLTARPVAATILPSGASILGGGASSSGGTVAVYARAAAGGRVGRGADLDGRWWEFGSLRTQVTTYTRRSPKGNAHQVTRHTGRQLPIFQKRGYVIYPTVAEITPRMVTLWVSIIRRLLADAVEGTSTP